MDRVETRPTITQWLEEARPWQTFLLVFVPVLVVYLATMAHSNYYTNVDTVAAGLPAWRFAQFGDLDLSQFGELRFIDEINGRIMSNRTPGISFLATPAYWLFGDTTFVGVIPGQLPATATAAVLSAGAVGSLHLVFRRIVSPLLAVGAALIFGFGTSTWSMSAAGLWPHGPGQFFLALALLGIASRRYLAAGLAFGSALIIRPVTGVMAIIAPTYLSWKQRSWRPMILVGLSSALGLIGLVLFNGLVIGNWSLAPESYGAVFLERARSQSVGAYVGDLALTFFSTRYSLFLFSPFLIFTIPGLRSAWRRAELWVRAGGMGALAYLLVTVRLNRHGGGQPFNYRYPLEPLILAAPLLLISVQEWYRLAGPGWKRLFRYAVVLAFAAQVIAISARPRNWEVVYGMYDLGLITELP